MLPTLKEQLENNDKVLVSKHNKNEVAFEYVNLKAVEVRNELTLKSYFDFDTY